MYFGAPKRIFLQGADGFAADCDVLMKTAELLRKYVPSVETIGGYARIDNFYDKTEQHLRDMSAMGFANPYIGVESGDDVVFKRINKGYTAAQAREVLEKIDASGLPYIVNFEAYFKLRKADTTTPRPYVFPGPKWLSTLLIRIAELIAVITCVLFVWVPGVPIDMTQFLFVVIGVILVIVFGEILLRIAEKERAGKSSGKVVNTQFEGGNK